MSVFKSFVAKHFDLYKLYGLSEQLLDVFDKFVTDNYKLSMYEVGTLTDIQISRLVANLLKVNIDDISFSKIIYQNLIVEQYKNDDILKLILSLYFDNIDIKKQLFSSSDFSYDISYKRKVIPYNKYIVNQIDHLTDRNYIGEYLVDSTNLFIRVRKLDATKPQKFYEKFIVGLLNVVCPNQKVIIKLENSFYYVGQQYNSNQFTTYLYDSGRLKAIPYFHILADGRSLNLNLYFELFNTLGFTYGGSGTSFNLPTHIIYNEYDVVTDDYNNILTEEFVVSGIRNSQYITDEFFFYHKNIKRLVFQDGFISSNLDGTWVDYLVHLESLICNNTDLQITRINSSKINYIDAKISGNTDVENDALCVDITTKQYHGLGVGKIIFKSAFAPTQTNIDNLIDLGWTVILQ